MFETLRIGELALRDHLVRAEDLERAVAARRTAGGRLGSILVMLGHLAADQVSQLLAEQHGVLAATEQELRAAGSAALGALPRELAVRFVALPLRLEGATLHVAMRDPQDLASVDRIGAAAGCAIQPHAAAEMLLFRYLGVHYQAPVPERYQQRPAVARSGGGAYAARGEGGRTAPAAGAALPGAVPPAPAAAAEESSELVFLDQVRARAAGSDLSLEIDLDECLDAGEPNDGGDPLDALDIDIDVDVVTEEVQEGRQVSVEGLLEQLAVAADAEAVIGLLLKPFVTGASLVVLLRPRGATAIALGAAGAAMPADRVRGLQVPLRIAAHVEEAVRTRAAVRRLASDDPSLQGIAGQLGAPPPREVCAAPVCVGDKVANVLCVYSQGVLDEPALEGIERVATAGGAAYGRLIAARKRSG